VKVALLSRATLLSQPGGDTVHMQETQRHLRNLGIEADLLLAGDPLDGKYDVLHFFNMGRPADLLPYLQADLPIVLSSIYVDYSAVLPRLLARHGAQEGEYLKTIRRAFLGRDRWPPLHYWLSGQGGSVKRILARVDVIITATRAEAQLIETHFGTLPRLAVIPLGCEHLASPAGGDEAAREGILCVARFEPLKNQKNLIKAWQKGLPRLTLVGSASPAHRGYWQECLALAADKDIVFTGNLPAAELPAMYQSHQVHILPSFYESTGLASIEAALGGCRLVVSDHPIQRELFGNRAIYAHPRDPQCLYEALQVALQADAPDQKWLRETFSWAQAAKKLLSLYHQVS